jgi:Mn-dependent DtxR family transcriptional regulator
VIVVKIVTSHYSESLEDYLEMIFLLGKNKVRSVDIATKMNVSKASVNRAVNTLIEKGLVSKALYGEISLTETGLATSENVLRKHLVLTKFLVNVLGVDPTIANDEACGIEHNISDGTLQKFEKLVKEYKK